MLSHECTSVSIFFFFFFRNLKTFNYILKTIFLSLDLASHLVYLASTLLDTSVSNLTKSQTTSTGTNLEQVSEFCHGKCSVILKQKVSVILKQNIIINMFPKLINFISHPDILSSYVRHYMRS